MPNVVAKHYWFCNAHVKITQSTSDTNTEFDKVEVLSQAVIYTSLKFY